MKKTTKSTQHQTIARKDGKIIVMLTLIECDYGYQLDEWDAIDKKYLVDRRYKLDDGTHAIEHYELLQTIIMNSDFDEVKENITEEYLLAKDAD